MTSRTPPDEDQRLEELAGTGLLDTPAERRFDRLTEELAWRLDAPIAYLALIDSDRQWLKSKTGEIDREIERQHAFCSETILGNEPVVVEDATADSRFSSSRLVKQEPGLRFYAGVPVVGPGGRPVGTVCVADRRARKIDPRQIEILKGFAQRVEEEITARPRVFLAFAEEDVDWMLGLAGRLPELLKPGLLDPWSTRRLEAERDSPWKVRDALERAAVAVLLISERFLASGFAADRELLELARRRREEGLEVLAARIGALDGKGRPELAGWTLWPADGRVLKPDDSDLGELASRVRRSYRRRRGPVAPTAARPTAAGASDLLPAEPAREETGAAPPETGARVPRVFLSHAGEDAEVVRELAGQLRSAGVDVWLDLDELEPGDRWMEGIETGLESCQAFAVYVGRSGIARWVGSEVRVALDRSVRDPGFRVIPILGPGADPKTLPSFLRQHQWLDLRRGIADPGEIRRLVGAILDRPAEVVSLLPPGQAPFRGLLAFDVEHTHLFFGRDRETEELLERMHADRFLAVIGDSGSGKSSLVRAGLVPALHRGRFHEGGAWAGRWRVAILRPGSDPFHELGNALQDLAPEMTPAEKIAARAACGAELARDADGIGRCLAGLVESGERTLLVVDQFEELFTHVKDAAERDRFIDSLLSAAAQETDRPVHAVVTLRADFYSECFAHPALPRAIARNQFALRRIGRDGLREAIERPVALAGARLEPGLAEAILHDVGDEPGNLPLLEHTLLELWERRTSNTLTHDAYEAIGRVRGALEHHAEEVFGRLGEEAQRVARRIFLGLVRVGRGAQATRRRTVRSEIVPAGEAGEKVEAVLLHLVEKRLLTVHRATADGEGGEDHEVGEEIEVAHEALIRSWDRLRRWLDEDRQFLDWYQRTRASFEAWEEARRDPKALLQGVRLAEASRWLCDRRDDLSPDGREFVERSIARGRRMRWIERGIAGLLALLLLGAVGFAAVFVRERDRARTEAMTAEEVIRFLTDDMLAAANPWSDKKIGLTAGEILDQGAAEIMKPETLAGEPLVKARLMKAIGTIYYRLGDLEHAAEHLGQALESYSVERRGSTELAEVHNNLGVVLLAKRDWRGARERFEAARSTYYTAGGGDDVTGALYLCNLAQAEFRSERPGRARELFQRALDIFESESGGSATGAVDLAGKASCENNFADLLRSEGELVAAKERYESALAIRRQAHREDHPDVAQSTNNLGYFIHLLAEREKEGSVERSTLLRESEEHHRRAVEIWRERLPGQTHLAVGLLNLAWVREDLGRFEECREPVRTAGEIFERLDNRYWRAVAASVYGGCLSGLGACEPAEQLLAESFEAIRAAAEEDPGKEADLDRACRRLARFSEHCPRAAALVDRVAGECPAGMRGA